MCSENFEEQIAQENFEEQNYFITKVFLEKINELNIMFYKWLVENSVPQEKMYKLAIKLEKSYPQLDLTKEIPVIKL